MIKSSPKTDTFYSSKKMFFIIKMRPTKPVSNEIMSQLLSFQCLVSKLWRILRPGIAIHEKFKIRMLFGVEYQGKAGVIVCFK